MNTNIQTPLLIFLVLIICKQSIGQWTKLNGPYSATINTLFSAGEDFYAGTNDGLFKSPDKGFTWIPLKNGMEANEVTSFINIGSDLFAATAQGLYQSNDNGAFWKYVDLDSTEVNITSLTRNDSTLFAAGRTNKVYTSSDNGISWNIISLPDSIYPVFRPGIQCIAANNSNLFVGTYLYGAYRFNLETKTLVQINAGLTHPRINCLLIDGDYLFAGIRYGVFLSTDSGTSWKAMNKGIPVIWGQMTVTSMTCSDNFIVAGIAHTVAISSNHGADWKGWIPYYDSFPDGISVLSVLYRDSTIYMGTESNGLWSYKIPAITSDTGKDPVTGTSQYSLNQNYPNPFNPATTISFNLSKAEWVTINIYNNTGQRIKTITDKNYSMGNHTILFDASDLASGIYYYKLKTKSFIRTRKMLLIK